ncbi:MAG: histidine kinase [Proteobacteria bacterium]|nr:histidine kinase [Pseudomonadota bacterium]
MQGLLLGLLLGGALASVDVSSMAPHGYVRDGAWRTTIVVTMGWTFPGILLAWTAQLVEGRGGTGLIILSFVVVLVIDVATYYTVMDPILVARTRPLQEAFVFRAWLILFYGGSFFSYCLLTQRTRRVEALLATAESERVHSATLADEARADALSARIQPSLLLRVLGALQATYPQDSARARALLDQLTDFLRLAMPTVRGKTTTLHDELSLLRAWSNLVALLEPGGGTPPVRLPDLGVAPNVDANLDAPFPPRTLVPLVEQLLGQQWSTTEPVRIAWQREASALRLTIAADSVPPGWLEGEHAQEIARELGELYECGANLEVGSTGCVFDLRFRTPA